MQGRQQKATTAVVATVSASDGGRKTWWWKCCNDREALDAVLYSTAFQPATSTLWDILDPGHLHIVRS